MSKPTKLYKALDDLVALAGVRQSFELSNVKRETEKSAVGRELIEDMDIQLLDSMDEIYKMLDTEKLRK